MPSVISGMPTMARRRACVQRLQRAGDGRLQQAPFGVVQVDPRAGVRWQRAGGIVVRSSKRKR